MRQMQGEVALITGGSGGIGLAAAARLAAQGACVYLLARDEERLQRAAARLSGDVRTLRADHAVSHELTAAMVQVARERGSLDVLVNCAGQLEVGPAEELGSALTVRLMEANFLGTVRAIEAALPLLRRGQQRSIVTVASLAGLIAPPFMAAYAASKFALVGYMRSLRQELRAEGFHLGLVCPGPVTTAMVEGRLHTEHYRLPPGTPIIGPEAVADEIVRMIRMRKREIVVPRRLAPGARLGALCPELVDRLYRWVNARRLKLPAGDSEGKPTRS